MESTVFTTLASKKLNDAILDEPRNIDEASATVTYIGFAKDGSLEADPVWAIKKIETVGSLTTFRWATAKRSLSNIWNNRAALIYV